MRHSREKYFIECQAPASHHPFCIVVDLESERDTSRRTFPHPQMTVPIQSKASQLPNTAGQL